MNEHRTTDKRLSRERIRQLVRAADYAPLPRQLADMRRALTELLKLREAIATHNLHCTPECYEIKA